MQLSTTTLTTGAVFGFNHFVYAAFLIYTVTLNAQHGKTKTLETQENASPRAKTVDQSTESETCAA